MKVLIESSRGSCSFSPKLARRGVQLLVSTIQTRFTFTIHLSNVAALVLSQSYTSLLPYLDNCSVDLMIRVWPVGEQTEINYHSSFPKGITGCSKRTYVLMHMQAIIGHLSLINTVYFPEVGRQLESVSGIGKISLFWTVNKQNQPQNSGFENQSIFSVADPDPGSGAFLTPGSGIRDPGWF